LNFLSKIFVKILDKRFLRYYICSVIGQANAALDTIKSGSKCDMTDI
jgi:hypothetical protein